VPAANSGNPSNTSIELKVNGSVKQSSTTSKLIWNIAETIEHLSSYWRLEPGDLIFTGTPEGVGPVVRGDVMEGSVAGVGTLKVRMV
jgi:fumarylpyruvate hydrolase